MPILPPLNEQSVQLTKLQQLYTIQNLLNITIKNILLVNQGELTNIQTFVNPNLYRIAVTNYGNADLWTAIANANFLTLENNPNVTINPHQLPDPNLVGTFTLIIPPQPVVDSGGLLGP